MKARIQQYIEGGLAKLSDEQLERVAQVAEKVVERRDEAEAGIFLGLYGAFAYRRTKYGLATLQKLARGEEITIRDAYRIVNLFTTGIVFAISTREATERHLLAVAEWRERNRQREQNLREQRDSPFKDGEFEGAFGMAARASLTEEDFIRKYGRVSYGEETR